MLGIKDYLLGTKEKQNRNFRNLLIAELKKALHLLIKANILRRQLEKN